MSSFLTAVDIKFVHFETLSQKNLNQSIDSKISKISFLGTVYTVYEKVYFRVHRPQHLSDEKHARKRGGLKKSENCKIISLRTYICF